MEIEFSNANFCTLLDVASESQGCRFNSCQRGCSCIFPNCSWLGLNVYKIYVWKFHLQKPMLYLFYERDAQNLDIYPLETFTVKSCQDPGTPWRGNKKGNLQVGQTLYFSCDQCYQLRGSATRTCQSDLSWSGRQPTCTGELHGFSFEFSVFTNFPLLNRTWAYGPNLVWGAHYSLTEQTNWTFIFCPKIVGERGWDIFPGGGGDVPKNFFPDIPKIIFRHTKYLSTNIRKLYRTYQKMFPNIT
jgi:hypothetical protein